MRNLLIFIALVFVILRSKSTDASELKEKAEPRHPAKSIVADLHSSSGSPQQNALNRKKKGKGKGKGKGKKTKKVPAKTLAIIKDRYAQQLEESIKKLRGTGVDTCTLDVEEHMQQYTTCGPRNFWSCVDDIINAIYSCRNSPNGLQCVKNKLPQTCLDCISKVCIHIPFACDIIPSLCCKEVKWKSVHGSECNRDCTENTDFYNCKWNFTARVQNSNETGRLVDGRNRKVLTYNGQIPGPSIVVCELDTVEIFLQNSINETYEERHGQSNGTTLHMHGIRRWNQSYEDGVPGINQCEIPSGGNFTYTMIAYDIHQNAPQGTYWYHSHVGSQRTNGLYGALIIKPRSPPNLYDIDDSNYTLVLQEWYVNETRNLPISILINGTGRVSEKMNYKPVIDENNITMDMHVDKYNKGQPVDFDQIPNPDYGNYTTNYTEYHVKYGKRYRFRIIGAISQNFPLCVSIQDHKFTAIATDSIDFKPVKNVDVVCLTAGERYDIVIKTKTKNYVKKNPYKIKVFGNSGYSSPLCTVAWLKYPGQNVNYQYTVNYTCAGFTIESSQKVLNPVLNHEIKNTTNDITIDKLNATIQPKTIRKILDPRNYFVLSDLTFNNLEMTYNDVPFLFQNPANLTNRCGPTCDKYFNFTAPFFNENVTYATLNLTCDDLPPKPDHCNETTEGNCQCEHIVHQPHVPGFLGEYYWFETILINPYTSSVAHPIHQHGGWYSVLAVKQFDTDVLNVTKEAIMSKDKACHQKHGCLPRKFNMPVQKDTIQVPVNGYVIFRTPLDNAGTWIVHCHINHHVESGMAMVFQIGGLPVEFKFEGALLDALHLGSLPYLPLPSWSQDWHLGPYEDKENKKCAIKLNTYQNPAAIDWFYGMKPIVACTNPGNSITFTWLYGHNVNSVSKEVWENCRPEGILPPDAFNNTARETGPHIWHGNTTIGTYYFACGVDNGYHCKHGGLKAKVTVTNEC